jgi:CRP-like cAMP-binding protein
MIDRTLFFQGRRDVGIKTNFILSALPEDDRQRLTAQSSRVALNYGQVLLRPGIEPAHVYFPLSGLISLLHISADGRALETAIVGRDGMVGLFAFLGGAAPPFQALVQMPGEALRFDLAVFKRQAIECTALNRRLLVYAGAVLRQEAQLAVCNALHPVTQRCARWLLVARDAAGDVDLPFTRTFLAYMLGVRRASASNALGVIEEAGIIRTNARHIQILDPAGLEQMACECYAEIRSTLLLE